MTAILHLVWENFGVEADRAPFRGARLSRGCPDGDNSSISLRKKWVFVRFLTRLHGVLQGGGDLLQCPERVASLGGPPQASGIA